MKDERGSAVVIVLVFLGIASMIGAGLLLQTQLDTQFTAAVNSTDQRLDMAEAGVAHLFRYAPDLENVQYQEPPFVVPLPAAVVTDLQKMSRYDRMLLRTLYIGKPDCTKECLGTGEIGQEQKGYSSGPSTCDKKGKYYVVATTGKAPLGRYQETVIQMGCLQCF